MKPTAYPLAWPPAQERTPAEKRERSRFGRYATPPSRGRGIDEVRRELRLLGATDVTISSDVPLKLDGEPYAYATRKAPDDPGAAVWFKLHGHPRVMACDAWRTLGENLTAIARTVEAMRGIDRWRSTTIEQLFEGHRALPAIGQTGGESWFVVLEVEPTCEIAEIDAAFRRLSAATHPDRPGGSHRAQARLSLARQQGIDARGGRNR